MQARLTSGARKLLYRWGHSHLVIRLVEMETGDSIGIAREIQVEFAYPENREEYHRLVADGIEVLLDPRLKVADTVKIKKQGFWKFAGLYVDGVRVPL